MSAPAPGLACGPGNGLAGVGGQTLATRRPVKNPQMAGRAAGVTLRG